MYVEGLIPMPAAGETGCNRRASVSTSMAHKTQAVGEDVDVVEGGKMTTRFELRGADRSLQQSGVHTNFRASSCRVNCWP